MRSNIAYYLVILYTIALCKPVLPLVQDKLAHILWKAEHIATIHDHHGAHHAEHEMAEQVIEEENDKKSPATTKSSEPVSFHMIIPIHYNIGHSAEPKFQFVFGVINISTLTLDKQYPPPKSC